MPNHQLAEGQYVTNHLRAAIGVVVDVDVRSESSLVEWPGAGLPQWWPNGSLYPVAIVRRDLDGTPMETGIDDLTRVENRAGAVYSERMSEMARAWLTCGRFGCVLPMGHPGSERDLGHVGRSCGHVECADENGHIDECVLDRSEGTS